MLDRPLHIGVDARCLNGEHLRGMGKSLFELVRRTAGSGEVEWHLMSDRPDLPMQAPRGRNVDVSLFESRGYRFHAWEQFALPRRASRLHLDLLHAPATSMPWWQPLPTVVTIHDTIPWENRDPAWPKGFYRDWLLPSAYRRASAVITVSQTSRRDIVESWPELAARLYVVSPGVDERYLDAQPDDRPIVIGDRRVSEPYLLYLGGADPRKRLGWALQAWQNVADSGASLVVCGLEAAAHEAVAHTIPPELRDRLILAPFVDEAEMPRLYMRSAAVLYPSTYEGFGLPVIEAQAVGTPVLFSDVGSLTELKGPGAVVLPMEDLAAWVRALSGLLRARAEDAGPSRIARAWARRYSWEAYTEHTLQVYDAVRLRPSRVEPRHRPHPGVAT